jgi:8-oxo-dGTP pyrophosphatase MutT (NUDIX family)
MTVDAHPFERTPVERQTSRVIIVDPQGRSLLMGVVLPESGKRVWFPPGGGAEHGEDAIDTARRELLEETGLRVSRHQLAGPIARSAGHWTASDGTVYAAVDTYFAIVVEPFAPDTSGFTRLERDIGADFRWWTADEINTTDDTVYPIGLAAVLVRLASGDIPTPPLELPWS